MRSRISHVLIPFFLCFAAVSVVTSQDSDGELESWKKSFQEAESIFNSVSQYSCVSLFQDLVLKITEAASKRPLSDAAMEIRQKSLDYLGQAYFNNNELDQTKTHLMKLIELNPGYTMNEDLVSFKIIEFFDQLKKENLGVLRVESTPAGAIVKIDGRSAGTSGNDIYSLTGTRAIEVSKPGYVSRRQTVNIQPDQTAQITVLLESNPLAMQTYADGISKLQVLQLDDAKRRLEKSLTELPDYSLFRSALAETFWWEGRDERAQQEVKKAFADIGNLAEPDRSIVQTRYHLIMFDYEKSIESARGLLQSDPKNIDYGLYMAVAQMRNGKSEDALSIIDGLRRTASGEEVQPRLDLLAAQASMHDPERRRTLAAKAAEVAQAKGMVQVAARARILEGAAVLRKYEPDRAEAAFEEARKGATSSNDLLVIANALSGQGDVLLQKGRSEEALAKYQEAWRLLEEIGNKSEKAEVQYRIGNARLRSGSVEEAKKSQQEALALARQTHNRYLTAVILCDMGGELLDRMDRGNARARYEEALEIFREIGDRVGMARALIGVGDVMIELKDAKGAKDYYDQALGIADLSGDKALSAAATRGIGDVHKLNGSLEVARTHYEESSSLSRLIQDRESLARTLYKLGTVYAELKNLELARKSYEEAIVIFREMGDRRYLARTEVSLRELTQEQEVKAIGLLQSAYELMNAKDYPAAESKYQEALEISRRIDDKRGQMVALLSLGFILSTREDDPGSQKLWEEALALSREINDRKNESLALWNLSVAAFNMGDRSTAHALYDQSAAISREIGEAPRERPW